MRILVSGASGLIGSQLVPTLERNHEVVRLVRRRAREPGEMSWEPTTPPAVTGFDAVVHLAGETIMGRWTSDKKARIRETRVVSTRNLAMAMTAAGPQPRTFIVASATGYYGPRGNEILTEDSPPGSGFLAQVTQGWEAAADPARRAGIRVVHLRTGVVLSTTGGALKQMLIPFRLGIGGRVGSGRQWMSWISLADEVGAILFLLGNVAVSGPVNLVAPNPVTNVEFTQALARALRRPALLPLPAAIVKFALGEMGESLLLASQRVLPTKLQSASFQFRHARLVDALGALL